MKHHLSILNAHALHEQHWQDDHAGLIALIITCIVAATIILLLSMVHIYFTYGIWPLFG